MNWSDELAKYPKLRFRFPPWVWWGIMMLLANQLDSKPLFLVSAVIFVIGGFVTFDYRKKNIVGSNPYKVNDALVNAIDKEIEKYNKEENNDGKK